MAGAGEVILQLRDITQDYGGLRPLRVKALDLHAGESLALIGPDQSAAALLVDLITGASLPRAGDVRAFGTPTTEIPDSAAWLRALERFGLYGERSVLIEQLTVEQNLAIPFTMDLDPLDGAIRERVGRLAADAGLASDRLVQPVGGLSALDRALVRLARALALEPRLLLVEHPTATLERSDVATLATQMSRAVTRRRIAALYLTADRDFAEGAGAEIVTLKPATGEVVPSVGWRRWFV
jgi:ABC-type lipoprotein export system ATPase subunit